MRKILQSIISRMGTRGSRPAEPLSASAERERRRKTLGRRGEEAAVAKLQQAGYRILERNYLCRTGEIDIIAEDGGTVVFVEVKTRSPRAWDTPESAVTPEKRARVIRAATYYQSAFRHPSPARYDIVSVFADEQDRITKVEIKRKAFGPDMV